MKAIGISQRVVTDAHTGERRDCLDQAWGRLAAAVGFLPVPLPNVGTTPRDLVRGLSLTGVILSGGNDIASLPGARAAAPERDAFEAAIIDHCLETKLPLFAVCRGMQLLNMHLGGTLRPIEGHAAKRHDVSPADGEQSNSEERKVNSFHDYGLAASDLSPELVATWQDEAGWIEGAYHASAPICAVMWHPEREQPHCQEDLDEMARLFGL